jgi:ribokinase
LELTVLGGFGVNKTVALERIPDAGETVSGGLFTQRPGGKGSNQAVQLALLGISVNMVTAIGQDDFGQVGRQLWLGKRVGNAGVVEIAAGLIG